MPPANPNTINVGFSDEDTSVIDAMTVILKRLETLPDESFKTFVRSLKDFRYARDNAEDLFTKMMAIWRSLEVHAVKE